MDIQLLLRLALFQSTFPRGERLLLSCFYYTFRQVSIHVPTRGTTRCLDVERQLHDSFNPRSHEGNDSNENVWLYDIKVSIHVPTRGTTPVAILLCFGSIVSIHVPTRGTTTGSRTQPGSLRFQSTFPRGERRRTGFHPARIRGSFNPRSHEGNDYNYPSRWHCCEVFQSTFPRGERQSILAVDYRTQSFNPRSHEGNDHLFSVYIKTREGFNPRSHEGNDTLEQEWNTTFNTVSIHVPTRGTT